VLANSPERNAVVALHSPKSIRTFAGPFYLWTIRTFNSAAGAALSTFTLRKTRPMTSRNDCHSTLLDTTHATFVFSTLFYPDKRKRTRTRYATRENSIDATGLTLQRRDKRYLRGHYWERDSTNFDAVLRGDADATRTKPTRRYWLRRHSMQRNRTQQTRLGRYAYSGLPTFRTGEPLGDTL